MENLLHKWQSFKDKIRATVVKELTFNYNSLGQQALDSDSTLPRFAFEWDRVERNRVNTIKGNIVEALSMWKFIAKYFVWYEYDLDKTAKEKWEDRRKNLSVLLAANTDNYYIQLLIMLESMPTSIFRRIIWSYNIDFMSPESFFRRLTETQRVGIATAYREFWHNQIVPEIFRRRGWFTKKVSRDNLLSSEFDEETRYASAGTMSYNLLGMDFGFNAYPKGINDDTKVVEISPLRFLSIKNHADDFIVNQEDGIYFQLYKTARSNYVICPNKKVKLKTHVCPGFWYTMFVHTIFWLASPLLAVSFIGTWFAGGFSGWPWYLIALSALPGVVTPLWLFLAGCKYLYKYVTTKYLSKTVKAISEFCKKHKSAILDTLYVIDIVVLGSLLVKGIGTLYRLVPDSELAWITLFILYLLLWLVRGATHIIVDINEWKKPESWLRCVKLSIRVVTFILFIQLVLSARDRIWNFTIAAAVWIYGLLVDLVTGIMIFFQAAGLFSLVLLFPVAIAVIIWRLNVWDRKREKKEETGEIRVLTALSYIVGALFIIFIIAGAVEFVYFITLMSWSAVSIFILIAGAAVVISLFVEWLLIWEMKPVNRQASSLVRSLNARFSIDKVEDKIGREAILKNRWLMSLPLRERDEQVNKISDLIFTFFDFSSSATFRAALSIGLRHINEGSLTRIEKAIDQLRKLKGDISKEDVFVKMIFGYSLSTAILLVTDKIGKEKAAKLAREKRWLKTKKVFGIIFIIIFYPFLLVGKFLGWIFEGLAWVVGKLIEFIKTFYRLYELFNKRCPYVAPVRRLNL